MKKRIWAGVLAALLLVSLWGGRMAWRAHRDIVSLDVSGASLEEVIASLRRQTRETIVVDGNLHARITLQLRNVPLAEALQRVGAQAGALAGTVHAVYDTRQNLDSLKAAFEKGADISVEGWTNLVPVFDLPVPGKRRQLAAGTGEEEALPPGAVRRVVEDVQVRGSGEGSASGPPGATPSAGRTMMVMRMQKADGSGKTVMEIWSPERIVTRAAMAARLEGKVPSSPSRAEAESTARTLKARCETLYALKRAPGGIAPGRMDMLTGAAARQAQGTNNTGPGGMAMPDNVEARVRREKLAQYENLTPQQRVERMRELRAMKGTAK